VIAERLGRTVGELGDTITDTELECWMALLDVEAHEAKVARSGKGGRQT
jgi:hypothetical protein